MNEQYKIKPIKKRWWAALFSGAGLWVSILVHILFFAVAAYIVVEHFQKKHVNFQATAPPAPPTEVEHKIELAKRNNVDSAPPDLKRITTTELSPISLPDVPELPKTDEVTPTSMPGMGQNGAGMGMGGGGGGGGGGDNGEPPPTLFGAERGEGLVGTLYDLKQTPDRRPTDMASTVKELSNSGFSGWNTSAMTSLISFLRTFGDTWDEGMLDRRYYKAPIKLVATQIFMPVFDAGLAPKAFNVEGTVQPRRWVVLYKAKVVPPKTGAFRFIGFGDDILLVRANGQNVLDGSWKQEQVHSSANDNDDVGLAPLYTKQPLACGKWIDMVAGQPVDLEILIGEGPGGNSSFYLMIQEQGLETTKGDYAVFQLKDTSLPKMTPVGNPPAFTGKKMVFGVLDSSADALNTPPPQP